MKEPLIILSGPTAVGKTRLSIRLAKALDGEIISADSMQIYKYMDIGSAKIRPEQMQGVRHYLIDELEPDEEFHVVRFQQMARQAMKEIRDRGKLPIVAGGTGFYIQALLYDIDFTESEGDAAYRAELGELARKKGAAHLHGLLQAVDPASAAAIHENNLRRVIRALEFYKLTGARISDHNRQERSRRSPYAFCYFVLTDERERLYARIDERVDEMMADGLLEEVAALKERGYRKDLVSMQGLGYRELLAYLDGSCTLPEAVAAIKQHTRHFAKRQLTWFRRERDVIWIDLGRYGHDEEKVLDVMLSYVRERIGVSCRI